MPPVEPNQVANGQGVAYWRGLRHLADSPEMREIISKEFPGYDANEMVNSEAANSSRRRFLKLAGASMALAGMTLSGCRRWPEEKLAPYATNVRDRMPGVPEQYATAWELCGVAQPLLVSSYDGRPIKIEGNPSHPWSWTIQDKIGSASALAQATLLDMYDPQRSRHVVDRSAKEEKDSSWQDFESFVNKHFAGMRGNGAGFAILSEALSGPTSLDMKKRLLKTYPQAKWYEYEPISWDGEFEGGRKAFGKPLRTRLHLEKASCVLLLDADLLGTHPASVRYAADWAERRRTVDDADPKMSRVYLAETGFSVTGGVADVRLPVNPGRLYPLLRAIGSRLAVAGVTGTEALSEAEEKFVTAAVNDLREASAQGEALVAAGPAISPEGHALAFAINEKFKAFGKTLTLLDDPSLDRPTHLEAITALTDEIKAGRVGTLLVLGGNPAFDAPIDLDFGKALKDVPVTIHLGLYENETSQKCGWHLPRAHYLETWGDARAWDGAAGVAQPLIQPLYGGRSIIETLALISGDALLEGHGIVQRRWRHLIAETISTDADFEHEFRKALEAGVLAGSENTVASDAKVRSIEFPPAPPAAQGTYLTFVPDSHVYDGRFANNGWLQETPDPLTKLVWDNAALISKKDADSIGVATGDMIAIELPELKGSAALNIAAYVMPGQPVGVVTLPLGYGRSVCGHIGKDTGFNTYAVRTTQGFQYAAGARVQPAPGSYRLVSTQEHHIVDTVAIGGRNKRAGAPGESGIIVHESSLVEYKADRAKLGGPRKISLQLFQPPMQEFNDTHAWGMAIDMNACIGCNACAVACQAENNIPVVGKIEAYNHRSMNWIRIDRYFKGEPEDPTIEVVHQPMMCQQCENAPCEQVCPVGATVHDSEGLNTMVYNRCIGTRYCSNNCPYKVRRFNYFDYHAKDPHSNWGTPYPNLPDLQQREQIDKIKQMVFNPDVSVRMRGVMEKCTYCVQRIHGATIAKRGAGGDVRDGDIVTACQQTCPTQAIVFGDLNDPNSKVSQLHKRQRSYGVLAEELDTRPRTMYLAKLRNPVEAEVKHEA